MSDSVAASNLPPPSDPPPRCPMCGGRGRTLATLPIRADGMVSVADITDANYGVCPNCMGSGHAFGWVGAVRDPLRAAAGALMSRGAELEGAMTEDEVPIEGLTPWVESGELPAILAAVARWYDGTDEDVDCAISITPWDVAPGGPRDLRPAIAIDVTCGPKGSRGAGCVVAWRGTDPAAVVPALDRCVAGCRAAHEVRRAKGTYYAGPDARGPRIELLPEEEGRP